MFVLCERVSHRRGPPDSQMRASRRPLSVVVSALAPGPRGLAGREGRRRRDRRPAAPVRHRRDVLERSSTDPARTCDQGGVRPRQRAQPRRHRPASRVAHSRSEDSRAGVGAGARHALPGQRSQARARAPREATPRPVPVTPGPPTGAARVAVAGGGTASAVAVCTETVAIRIRSARVDRRRSSAGRRQPAPRPDSAIAAPTAPKGSRPHPGSTLPPRPRQASRRSAAFTHASHTRLPRAQDSSVEAWSGT